MKIIKFVSLFIVLCIVAVGCSTNGKNSETTSTSKKFIQGKVAFEQCGIFECATISVPMDYKKPKGRKIDIAMTKRPAADKSKRVGVLIVNPGGPGASGIDFVKQNSSFLFSDEVLDRFDIIGWDPRGVGASSKPNCTKSLDKLFIGQDYSPDNQEELDSLLEANRWLGKQCEKADADLLPNLNTTNSARDIESMRKALGEDKINYLGFSYGTALGQIYATLFPDNFRSMVIDGVIDLELDPEKTAVEQIVGFEDSLNEFFNYCRNSICKYAKGKDPRTAYIDIVNSVDANPIKSAIDPDVIVDPAVMDIGVPYYLYGGLSGWRSLDSALTDLQVGDPAELFNGFSAYLGRSPGGRYDGSYESFLTIGCSDGSLGDEKKLIELSKSSQSKAPIFGESSVFLSLPCSTWPDAQESSTIEVENKGKVPIVVIGTTGDPATPVQWARSAAKSLGNSVYVERVGEGHTAYGQGNLCIDDLVNQYFISGIAPAPKTCN